VEEASKRGLDAEGVDFSEWAIGEANKRTADRCRVMNLDVATALDFPVAYDIITMHSVIEHLADPQKVLDLLFQISRPGAVVYVQTLNADSMMHKIMETQWEGYTDFTHKSPWISRDWLTGASIKTGFEVVKVKTDGAWCENKHDEVWSAFKFVIQSYPSSLLLEEAWGDFLEVILRHPEDYGSESYNKP
jgi:SAM-dependent methyltransferase